MEPGKLADMVVLSDDIFAIDPAAIEHVRVDATLLGGEVVFKRDAVPDPPMHATPYPGPMARRSASGAAGSGPARASYTTAPPQQIGKAERRDGRGQSD